MGIEVKENDYYSLHGIWGAYASLVLGRVGKGSGLVVGNVQPPARGLFAGYRDGASRPALLPFVPDVKVGLGAESYVAGSESAEARSGEPFGFFSSVDITRSISLSGETWSAGRMTMAVISFFGAVGDPVSLSRERLRKEICPALYVRVTFDNSENDMPLTGVFGMQGIRRPLSDSTEGALLGFAHGNDWGFAVRPEEGIEEIMDWAVLPAAFGSGPHHLRRLASEGALRFSIKPGERREFLIACGAYRDGVVTSGLRTRAFHAGSFHDLEDALFEAFAIAPERLDRARLLDARLDSANLSDDRKFLVAHAAHSYVASTELLSGPDGQPIFIVNEGEYQMKNTLDLTVDQAFHELAYTPWTVRNELDFFLSRSSYRDQVGLAFAHDQGVGDSFTPKGTSSYELPELTGCFSYMSYEETLNWLLTACLYAKSGDDRSWPSRNQRAIVEAVESVIARDGDGNGVMDTQSCRCAGGSEITTYDSLDSSLGQAKDNLYLAVKAWGALVCAADALVALGSASAQAAQAAQAARVAAGKIAHTVVSWARESDGLIPAVFEAGNEARIIPAVEGLVYPALCGVSQALEPDGEYGALVRALKRHVEAVLVPGICLDAQSGGWKLSSTSRNTWLSKIFINQYVVERIFGIVDERTARDAIHARWQREGSANWAATDQVDSTNGKDLGSRLYPRLVSSILWTL